jgi:hypothetical protein
MRGAGGGIGVRVARWSFDGHTIAGFWWWTLSEKKKKKGPATLRGPSAKISHNTEFFYLQSIHLGGHSSSVLRREPILCSSMTIRLDRMCAVATSVAMICSDGLSYPAHELRGSWTSAVVGEKSRHIASYCQLLPAYTTWDPHACLQFSVL